MIIKYRCWDTKTKRFRHPDPEHMVSIFIADGLAMRLVQLPGYIFMLWTGFEDMYGKDIFHGDILDDKYYVKWDVLEGRWGLYDSKDRVTPNLGFGKYKPLNSVVTGNVYETPEWLS